MKHIVHVDNSEFFRRLMKTYLSEKGLECESFESGEDAVNAVKGERVSFIITGLALADMSGEELIKRLTVLPRKTPVIVVTSKEDALQSKPLEALGVRAVILKSGNWKGELDNILA
jgi:two-component system cell cycle response regulator